MADAIGERRSWRVLADAGFLDSYSQQPKAGATLIITIRIVTIAILKFVDRESELVALKTLLDKGSPALVLGRTYIASNCPC